MNLVSWFENYLLQLPTPPPLHLSPFVPSNQKQNKPLPTKVSGWLTLGSWPAFPRLDNYSRAHKPVKVTAREIARVSLCLPDAPRPRRAAPIIDWQSPFQAKKKQIIIARLTKSALISPLRCLSVGAELRASNPRRRTSTASEALWTRANPPTGRFWERISRRNRSTSRIWGASCSCAASW